MPYEVEIKYAHPNLEAVRRQCIELGAVPAGRHSEIDTYLQHPSRSFAQTDEALRVRQANSRLQITYKGPRIDATTKTRTEIELNLATGKHSVQEVLELWHRLGFQPVREVRKERDLYHLTWQNCEVEICLDRVHQVGDFVELEISAESEHLEKSRQILQDLAQRIGLSKSERRSYLELLLEKEAAAADTAENAEDWTE